MEARSNQSITASSDAKSLTLGTEVLDKIGTVVPPKPTTNADTIILKDSSKTVYETAKSSIKLDRYVNVKKGSNSKDATWSYTTDGSTHVVNIMSNPELDVGKYNITGIIGDGKGANKSVTFTLNVIPTITLNDNDIVQIKVGGKANLSDKVLTNPIDALVTLSTTTSNTINIESTTITGMKVGEATVTAKVGDSTGQSVTIKVAVSPGEAPLPPETTLSLTSTVDDDADQRNIIIYGTEQSIELDKSILKVSPDGTAIKWQSTNEAIATVNKGTVTSHASSGKADITAYIGDASAGKSVIYHITLSATEGGRRGRSKGTVRQKLGKIRRRMGTRGKKQ